MNYPLLEGVYFGKTIEGYYYNNYKCKHCGQVLPQESTKAWIKSYCEKTGKNVRLVRIDNKTHQSK